MVSKFNSENMCSRLIPVLSCLLALLLIPGMLRAAEPIQQDEIPVISRIEVRLADAGEEVLIVWNRPAKHSEFLLSDPQRLVVDLADASLAVTDAKLNSSYKYLKDLSAKAITESGKSLVRIELFLKENADYSVKDGDAGLSIIFGTVDAGKAKASADARSMTQSLPKSSPAAAAETALAEKAPEPAPAASGQNITDATTLYGMTVAAKYKGKPIYLDLKDADLLDIFRLIAEVSGFNVVVDPDVSGRITIRMDEVPWDQALEVILKNQGLGKEIEGNIMRIARNEKLRDENILKEQLENAKRRAVPIETVILYLSYADISMMEGSVKVFLTERGSIQKDVRVNAMIIRDTRQQLDQIMNMIKILDVRTRQVALNAQIVVTSKAFTRDLGVAWGGKFMADAAHGNTTRYRFPNNYAIDFTGSTLADAPATSTYAVNLPAGSPLLGLSFGNILDTLKLNALLTASETEGLSKTISHPRVTTSNNQAASLSSGVSIPYLVKFGTAEGSSVDRINMITANTSLTITPHITNDNWISMNINLTRDFPGASTSAGPIINRNSANTQVLVKDGDTLVIGGLNETTFGDASSKIPWFADIPILGMLFKNSSKQNSFKDLLFFITPQILEEGERIIKTETF